MPRISHCDKLPENLRLKLVGRIGDSASWDTLAEEFNIPATSIHKWAKRNGYGRTPTAIKRRMVEDLLARPDPETTGETTGEVETTGRVISTGNPDVDASAHEDTRDMRQGLQAARLALQVSTQGLERLLSSDAVDDYRATKAWSECIIININTIRKIRGLDEPKAESLVDYAAMAETIRGKLGV